MERLLFGPFGVGLLCLQFVLCHSQVCIPTWTAYNRTFSNGATNETSARQLQDCLARCERRNNCLAIDFKTVPDISCWLHSNLKDLSGSSLYLNAIDGVTQYRINRNCTDYGKDPGCSPEWNQNASLGSYYGEQVNYWTEYDCFTYCRYSSSCVGVDYNNKTSPPCWIHRGLNGTNNTRAIANDGVVQYRLNKTCPSIDNSTNFRIGRCVGQYFPRTGWCPPRTNIHINDSWFRVNPLCCYRNSEDASPPDSLSLSSYKISYLNENYSNEINSTCDGMATCNSSLRAKGNSELPGLNCADGESGTNYVSIVYQCISDGSTTTQETTTMTTTGATKLGPAISLTATTSDVEKAPSNIGIKEKSSDPLIIGLVVGLGVPLILIIIIVIVVLVRRRKRKWKSEPKENHAVDNYFYNSETMPRGEIPENQQNEISMAVDAL